MIKVLKEVSIEKGEQVIQIIITILRFIFKWKHGSK